MQLAATEKITSDFAILDLLKLILIWSSLNYQIEISVCGTFDVDIIYLLIRRMHLETTRGIWQNKLSRFHILNNIAKLHVTFITVGTHVFISYDSQQTFIIDANLSITQFDWNCIYKLRLVIKNNQFQWYIYIAFFTHLTSFIYRDLLNYVRQPNEFKNKCFIYHIS